MTLTANQWRMLRILEHWDGHGTIEVEIQWGDYEHENDPEGSRGFRTCRLVVANLVKSLVKKGLATHDENGYGITEAGRNLVLSSSAK